MVSIGGNGAGVNLGDKGIGITILGSGSLQNMGSNGRVGGDQTMIGVNNGNIMVDFTSIQNVFVGADNGTNMSYSKNNTFVGDAIANQGDSLENCIGIGVGPLTYADNAHHIIAIGRNTGRVTTGNYSVYIGDESSPSTTSGFNNAFLGAFTGYKNTSGNQMPKVSQRKVYNALIVMHKALIIKRLPALLVFFSGRGGIRTPGTR